MSDGRSSSNGPSRRQSLGGADNISKLTSNGILPKRSPSFQLRSSGSSTVLKHAKGTSKSFDGGSRSSDRSKVLLNGLGPNFKQSQSCDGTKETETQSSTWKATQEEKVSDIQVTDTDDTVPGLLYDMLQKEVIALRKAGHEKDQSLKDKDDAIEVDFFLYLVTLLAILSLSSNFLVFPTIDVSKEGRNSDQSDGS